MKRREFITDALLAGGALVIGGPKMNGENLSPIEKNIVYNASLKKTHLKLISIEPLEVKHAKELVADIKDMAQRGVLNEVAFSMTLVPEGNPPIDKVSGFAESYKVIRRLLGDVSFKVGILVQATVGHNYTLTQPFAFQPQVSLNGAINDGSVCPYDEGFRNYLKTIFHQIALLRPDFFIIDDDFRLITNRNACVCPLHVSAFNKKYGTSLTQEQLRKHLLGQTAEDRDIAEKFDAVNAESLYGAADVIREAVDAVDTSIPAYFCTCIGDIRYSAGIEKRLTGKNHPQVIRLNNARYLQPGPTNFVVRMQGTAIQMATIGKTDCVLAETDTYPQNRYSTSARALHSNFTGYLLEGCMGAKHWITRMGEWEPNSGKAYRIILSKYRGFYEELSDIIRNICYVGPGTVIPNKPFMNWNRPLGNGNSYDNFEQLPSWNTFLPVGFGQPLHFRKAEKGAGMLLGPECYQFSDDEIRVLLTKGLLMDGTAAAVLAQRGFGEYLGAKAEPWEGKRIAGEMISENVVVSLLSGKTMSEGSNTYRLIPVASAEVVSRYFHRPFSHSTNITMGEVSGIIYKNSLGGRMVILGTIPQGIEYPNETRKAFLLSLLNWIEPYPLYYSGDEEVYLKVGQLADDSLLVAAINLTSDPIENVRFETKKNFTHVHSLSPNGEWKSERFNQTAHQIQLYDKLEFMLPVVWRLK